MCFYASVANIYSWSLTVWPKRYCLHVRTGGLDIVLMYLCMCTQLTSGGSKGRSPFEVNLDTFLCQTVHSLCLYTNLRVVIVSANFTVQIFDKLKRECQSSVMI